MLTQDYLKSILDFDPSSGIFYWKVKRPNINIGDLANNIGKNGYVRISIKNKKYYAHRLAWLYVYGEFPTNQIDHINRIRTDNRIQNLRDVKQSENVQNASIRKNKTVKSRGVALCKKTNKYRARIRLNGKEIYLGYFSTEEKAYAAYRHAAFTYHSINPDAMNYGDY